MWRRSEVVAGLPVNGNLLPVASDLRFKIHDYQRMTSVADTLAL